MYNLFEAIFIVSAGNTTNAEVLRSNEILVHIVLEQVVPQFSCRQVSSQLLILMTPRKVQESLNKKGTKLEEDLNKIDGDYNIFESIK